MNHQLLQSLVDVCPDNLLEKTMEQYVQSQEKGTPFVLPAEMVPYIRRAQLNPKQKQLRVHLATKTWLQYLPEQQRDVNVDRALQEIWAIIRVVEWNEALVKKIAEIWLGYRGTDKLGHGDFEKVKREFIVKVLPFIE